METTTKPTKTKTINPPQQKLILPSLLCIICTILYFIFNRSAFSFPFLSHYGSYLLEYTLSAFIMPFIPALALYLLYHLLKIIIYRTFRPIHLLSALAIILSTSIFWSTGANFIYPIFYLIIGTIFFATIYFQNPQHRNDPAHLRSYLITTSIISLTLGFLNFLIFAFYALPLGIPYDLADILVAIAMIILLPLQLTITFLTLTNPARHASPLSRHGSLLVYASLILTALAVISYTAIVEVHLADDYIPYYQHSYINN